MKKNEDKSHEKEMKRKHPSSHHREEMIKKSSREKIHNHPENRKKESSKMAIRTHHGVCSYKKH